MLQSSDLVNYFKDINNIILKNEKENMSAYITQKNLEEEFKKLKNNLYNYLKIYFIYKIKALIKNI
jgi:hypothetical protein